LELEQVISNSVGDKASKQWSLQYMRKQKALDVHYQSLRLRDPTVPSGRGGLNSQLMIVLDCSPTNDEKKLLTKLLNVVKLREADAYITFGNNIEALKTEIDIIEPRLILCLSETYAKELGFVAHQVVESNGRKILWANTLSFALDTDISRRKFRINALGMDVKELMTHYIKA